MWLRYLVSCLCVFLLCWVLYWFICRLLLILIWFEMRPVGRVRFGFILWGVFCVLLFGFVCL
jgi:hypothetical protein